MALLRATFGSRSHPRLFHAPGRLLRRLGPLLLMPLLALPSFCVEPLTFPEDQIKAGFLFNFTRFVDWPGDPSPSPSSPYILCILNDRPIADLLTQSASGKIVSGRGLSIRQVKVADDFHACNILFVSAAEERHAKRVLQSVQGTDVLTVGESTDFIQLGGMFNFAVKDNKVKLDLDLDSATHAGLKISAKLIAVSRRAPGSLGGSN